ncbi:MAG: toxin HicA [Deltaproteobacteria bacterium]|nr:toxin HicA [Deltaproteobacteria bacterium]
MAGIDSIVEGMRNNPVGVSFSDLCKVCGHYFGEHRIRGSHRIYKTPWMGDPRVNVQDDRGKAKAYQVRQVLRAIEKLLGQQGAEDVGEDT